jgi:hypothetical protein
VKAELIASGFGVVTAARPFRRNGEAQTQRSGSFAESTSDSDHIEVSVGKVGLAA